MPKDSGLASWRINIQNKSDYWGLWTVKFPYINGFLESGKYDVAVPQSNWGFLYKNCTQNLDSWYPEWAWPMQFLCAAKGNSSIYMATHDAQCWIKKYSLKPGKEFYFEHYVEDMGVAGSDFPAPYPAILGVYNGDWFNASKIYRKWVLKEALWTQEGSLSQRTSVPASIKDLGLWMLGGSEFGAKGTSTQEQDQPLKDAQSYFGVPVGYHWYNWHETPFDENYPHFFPARAGFEERVRDLVSAGLLIMPYINGWAIDDKIPDYDTFLPSLCKTESGTPFARIFGTTSGRLTVVCPTASYWHQTIADLVDRLGVMGLNSVYIDCIASVPPTLCFDKTHGHPLGGGHWWVDGYRELLRKVQAVAHLNGRNMVITSECNEEMFMDGVDAFLVWIKRDEKEI
ncbi:MAG: DUF6259 domain-containing protein, partial [Patescibacteria group bacterium]|nr:DUF6259 domain-containing protein [Patescibacteria group bacterium]